MKHLMNIKIRLLLITQSRFSSLSLSSQFPFVFSCLCYGAYKVVENCAGKMETNQGIFFYYIKIKDCILVFAQ